MLALKLDSLKESIGQAASEQGVPYRINGLASMFTGFFNDRDVIDYKSAASSDRLRYERFFKAMLEEGIFFAPSQFEAAFLTMTFEDAMVERVVEAFRRVFRRIKNGS